jgi:hypothetical protein
MCVPYVPVGNIGLFGSMYSVYEFSLGVIVIVFVVSKCSSSSSSSNRNSCG